MRGLLSEFPGACKWHSAELPLKSETPGDAILEGRPFGRVLDPLTKFRQVLGSDSGVKEHLLVTTDQVGEPAAQ